jgi:tRNA pseudouridine13 synthase
VQSEPITEKSRRTEAHLVVRRIFDSKLTTLTVQDQDHQSGPLTNISIKAAPAGVQQTHGNGDTRQANGKGKGEPRGKQGWAELGGDYLHFTLYKENKDTMEVLYFLASQMKLHVKNFGFAGTKDRRGVTVQRVSAYRVKQERMESLNRFARGWRIAGPWEYKPEGLDLGMLSGNQFLLTLRDAHFEGEQPDWTIQQRLENAQKATEAAAKSLTTHGYLNYFGLQRFGTHSTGTHATGMKMLKDDFKGAVESILAYDEALLEQNQAADTGADPNGDNNTSSRKKVPQEDIQRATALHNFRKDANSSKALSQLPQRFSAERGIVTHLGKRDRQANTRPNENDWKGALGMIQRNLRLMYVHAYQSFVWNTVAGHRWETLGNKVVEGDLVVVGEKEQQEGAPVADAPKKDEVDEAGEPVIHPNADASGSNGGPTSDDPFVRARPLSKEEVESGRYSIFDVVLPLPGFDVLYPSNSIGKFYVDFMASEAGGGLDPYNMRRSWKDISLSGSYRKMMTRPLGAVEAEVRSYSAVEEQMVRTDLEKLEGRNMEIEKGGAVEEGHDKVAVLLKLKLASSQYATMALRELTKGGAVGYRPDYSSANR